MGMVRRGRKEKRQGRRRKHSFPVKLHRHKPKSSNSLLIINC